MKNILTVKIITVINIFYLNTQVKDVYVQKSFKKDEKNITTFWYVCNHNIIWCNEVCIDIFKYIENEVISFRAL